MNALHARRRLPDLRHLADALVQIGPHGELGLLFVRQRQLQRLGRRQATRARQRERIRLHRVSSFHVSKYKNTTQQFF